jgi:hypothetical protein
MVTDACVLGATLGLCSVLLFHRQLWLVRVVWDFSRRLLGNGGYLQLRILSTFSELWSFSA